MTGLPGRERELAALRAWTAAAVAGRGRLVLVRGEAGIGKTRLAQELARGVADVPVVWGRCVDTDGSPPFWPWQQVLRALGGPLGDSAGPAPPAGSPQDRFHAVDAVAGAVLERARPLLVVIDDLHWADESSLLVLRRLAEQAPEAPLLLVATLRDGPRALSDLQRAPDAELVELRGLGPDDVRRQLDGLGATGVTAAEVHDATGGNPFFVREVARAVLDGTWTAGSSPRTVRDAVQARVDRLAPEVRQLLQAGAVLGRRFTPAVVAHVLGVAVSDIPGPADAAVDSGLLTRSGAGELRFVHALTRDAVHASVPTGDLLVLHRAAADALEAHWAGELDDHLAELAWHRLALAPYGEGEQARRWALRAAASVQRLAPEEAVRLYRAALAVPDPWPDGDGPCRARLDLGWACALAGDLDGALAAAGTAADLAMVLADDRGASAIVTVGSRTTLVDLLDGSHDSAASTFLTRLRVGPKLIDARAVAAVHRPRVGALALLLLVLAACVALVAALSTTPVGAEWLSPLTDALAATRDAIQELFR